MGASRNFVIAAALLSACGGGNNGGSSQGSSDGSTSSSETTDTTGNTNATFATETFGESGDESTDGADCPDGELGDDDNCGACGVRCSVYDLYAFGEYGGCDGDVCKPTWSPCFASSDGHADCAAACVAFGEECVAQGCGPDPGVTATAYTTAEACENFENPQDAWYGTTACDEAPPLGDGAGRCCCTDTP